MKYHVEIVETLSRVVEIEATTPAEAIEIVKVLYRKEKIVLDSGDFSDVDFIAKVADCQWFE